MGNGQSMSEGGNKVSPNSVSSETVQCGKIKYSLPQIGTGSWGTAVFKGSYDHDLRVAAIKRIIITDPKRKQQAQREAEMLTRVDSHQNIVRYYGHEFEDRGDVLLIALEYGCGTLHDFILEGQDIRMESISKRNIIHDITAGLTHLHEHNMAHGDLKPENILIVVTAGKVLAKISDFGMSKIIPQDRNSVTTSTVIGTLKWMPPEALTVVMSFNTSLKLKLTKEWDVFSLGCIFYYIITNGNHLPFESVEDIINQKCSLNIVQVDPCLVEFCGVIRKMISHAPEERPEMAEIACHFSFWDMERHLMYIVGISNTYKKNCSQFKMLETYYCSVVGCDDNERKNYSSKLCPTMQTYLLDKRPKKPNYEGNSMEELVRLIRSLFHHYNELKTEEKEVLGPIRHIFAYFHCRFPVFFEAMFSCFSEQTLIPPSAIGDKILSTEEANGNVTCE